MDEEDSRAGTWVKAAKFSGESKKISGEEWEVNEDGWTEVQASEFRKKRSEESESGEKRRQIPKPKADEPVLVLSFITNDDNKQDQLTNPWVDIRLVSIDALL